MYETITITEGLILLAAGALAGGIIAYYLCKQSSSGPTVDLSRNLISNNEAIANIMNKQSDGSNDAIISGHLPLNILLPYLQMLEVASRSAIKKVSGIEFYFTRYEEQVLQQGGNTLDNQRYDLSFLLYPTYENENGEFIPFDPIASKTEVVTLKSLKGNLATAASRTDSPSDYVALNRVNMSPPRGHTW